MKAKTLNIHEITYNRVGDSVERSIWNFLADKILPLIANEKVLGISDNFMNESHITIELRNKMNLTIASNTITIPNDN